MVLNDFYTGSLLLASYSEYVRAELRDVLVFAVDLDAAVEGGTVDGIAGLGIAGWHLGAGGAHGSGSQGTRLQCVLLVRRCQSGRDRI